MLTSVWADLFDLTHPNYLCLELKSSRKNNLVRKCINHPKQPWTRISIWAINGSQNNLIPVSELNFDCNSLIVGNDIEMVIFPFLVDNDTFFHQDGYATFGAYWSVILYMS